MDCCHIKIPLLLTSNTFFTVFFSQTILYHSKSNCFKKDRAQRPIIIPKQPFPLIIFTKEYAFLFIPSQIVLIFAVSLKSDSFFRSPWYRQAWAAVNTRWTRCATQTASRNSVPTIQPTDPGPTVPSEGPSTLKEVWRTLDWRLLGAEVEEVTVRKV